MKNPFKNKKFRYGSASVAVTLVFAALVIAFNALFSAVTENYSVNIDVTEDKLYSIGDVTKELLSDIDDDVTITFLQSHTDVESDSKSSYILTCAEQYQKEFPNVDIKFFDVYTDISAAGEYKKKLNLETLSPYYIVVESEQKSMYYNRDDFFVYDNGDDATATGFSGELRLTSAILQVANEDTPVVCFTTGHGETYLDTMLEAFQNSGFTVVYTDLSEQEIPENTAVLVIHNPTSDFGGASSAVDEIDKIVDYLNAGGNVLAATSYLTADTDLSEFDSLLAEWGVVPERTRVIYDATNSIATASYTGYVLKAQHVASDYSAKLFDGIEEEGKIVVPFASPISLRFDTNEASGISAEPILSSFATSVSVGSDNDTQAGPFNIATLSSRTLYEGDKEITSRLILFNTPFFAYSGFLEATYKNTAFFYNLIELTGEVVTVSGIEPKAFEDTTVTVETNVATTLAYVCSLVLPALIFAAGFTVFLVRRHK